MLHQPKLVDAYLSFLKEEQELGVTERIRSELHAWVKENSANMDPKNIKTVTQAINDISDDADQEVINNLLPLSKYFSNKDAFADKLADVIQILTYKEKE